MTSLVQLLGMAGTSWSWQGWLGDMSGVIQLAAGQASPPPGAVSDWPPTEGRGGISPQSPTVVDDWPPRERRGGTLPQPPPVVDDLPPRERRGGTSPRLHCRLLLLLLTHSCVICHNNKERFSIF